MRISEYSERVDDALKRLEKEGILAPFSTDNEEVQKAINEAQKEIIKDFCLSL